MDLVIDANILFAAIIKKNITSELIFKEEFRLYAPDFIFTEFEKYKQVIKKKTERTDQEFDELLMIFQRRVELISYEEIQQFMKKAEEISPDIKDATYIALALKLHIPIWSNDKELKKKQKEIIVYSTSDIIDMYEIQFKRV